MIVVEEYLLVSDRCSVVDTVFYSLKAGTIACLPFSEQYHHSNSQRGLILVTKKNYERGPRALSHKGRLHTKNARKSLCSDFGFFIEIRFDQPQR